MIACSSDVTESVRDVISDIGFECSEQGTRVIDHSSQWQHGDVIIASPPLAAPDVITNVSAPILFKGVAYVPLHLRHRQSSHTCSSVDIHDDVNDAFVVVRGSRTCYTAERTEPVEDYPFAVRYQHLFYLLFSHHLVGWQRHDPPRGPRDVIVSDPRVWLCSGF